MTLFTLTAFVIENLAFRQNAKPSAGTLTGSLSVATGTKWWAVAPGRCILRSRMRQLDYNLLCHTAWGSPVNLGHPEPKHQH